MRRAPVGLLTFAVVVAVSADAAAQSDSADDGARIRQAAAAEAAGDFAQAERVLAAALEHDPGSISALLAYERVLGLQRRIEMVLPAVERLLAQEPGSVVGHQVRLRTYAALDRPAEIERAAYAWLAAAPRTETPYRESARIWRARGEYRRAIDMLETGRTHIGRADALALELGDAYADAGDAARAVAAWSLAVGSEGQGSLLVQRRLAALHDGGARYIHRVVVALADQPTTHGRRRVAIQIAIEAGLAEIALAIARDVYGALDVRQRRPFLVEVARRADGAALVPVAYWAYGALVEGATGTGEQALALRTRFAELAMAVGDTAAAAAAYSELEGALAPGSPERRQAMALRIELTARDGDLATAERELAVFRAEYHNAPEHGRVAAALANEWLERGDVAAAERVLRGVAGAPAALARGRLFLRTGELTRARAAFLEAAPVLYGAAATEAIALATLLGRLSTTGGELLAAALGASAGGDHHSAVERLVTGSIELGGEERAALLAFAAAHADRADLLEYAEQARRELVDTHATSREAPAALLALARAANERGEAAVAQALLERLLLEHPRSALAPQARRELERLSASPATE